MNLYKELENYLEISLGTVDDDMLKGKSTVTVKISYDAQFKLDTKFITDSTSAELKKAIVQEVVNQIFKKKK